MQIAAHGPTRRDVEQLPGEEFFPFVEAFNSHSGFADEFSSPLLFKSVGKAWGIEGYDLERLNAEFGGLPVPVFHEWNKGFQKKNTIEPMLLSEHISNSRRDPMGCGYLLGAIDDGDVGQPDPAWDAVSRDELFEARKNRSHIISVLVRNTELRRVAGGTTAIFLGGRSITRMHQHQPTFLLQILGKKKTSLIAPHFARYVYCENVSLYAQNLIDFNDIDLTKFPLIEQITILDAVSEPGDLLFIPNRWFHYVEALEFPSLSLSRFSKPTKDS